MVRPVEGAEDSAEAAKRSRRHTAAGRGCGYLSGGWEYDLTLAAPGGKSAGALTIGIANNRYRAIGGGGLSCLAGNRGRSAGWVNPAESGTAQKICLNLISTQLMVLQGG